MIAQRIGQELDIAFTRNLTDANVARMQDELDGLELDKVAVVRLDINGVELLDTAGIALLVRLYATLNLYGVRFEMIGVPDPLVERLRDTGLADLWKARPKRRVRQRTPRWRRSLGRLASIRRPRIVREVGS